MQSKPDTVRTATSKDEAKIFSLLIEMHRHNNAGWGWPYDPSVVSARIETGTRPDPRTRTNPQDLRRGLIGVIDGPDGRLIGSVGVFLIEPVWFASLAVPTELWFFIRRGERGAARYERDLMAFAVWFRDALKAGPAPINYPFPLLSGLMHRGKRFEGMERLWRRLSGGVKCGVLFWID